MKGLLELDGLELLHPDEGVGKLSLRLPAGSGLVVIGRNGSGKSTLLMTLAGLVRSRAGMVRWGEQDLLGMDPRQRAHHLAFVPSTPPRGSVLTVRDVVELALEAGGHAGAEGLVDTAMEEHGIAHWGDRPLDALSDGMAQRVMLARGAIQAGGVLLLDEPTAFLDVVGRVEVMDSVGRWKRNGRTIIMATHDLEAVEEAGWVDHWLVMGPASEGGSVLHAGPFSAESAKRLLTLKS